MMQSANVEMKVKQGIIKRFIELDKKYPKEGAIASGFCRAESNPYLTYANWNVSPEITAKYHIKNLYKPVAIKGRDFKGYASNDGDNIYQPDQTERQVGKSARWLVNNCPEWLEKLFTEEWLEICVAQQIRPYHMTQIFTKIKMAI